MRIDSTTNPGYKFHNYDNRFLTDRYFRFRDMQDSGLKTTTTRNLNYRFFLHLHPYIQKLIQNLLESGIKGLQDSDTEKKSDGSGDYLLSAKFFKQQYAPSELVPDTAESPHPIKDLDFTASGAYSVYNWEMFYHVPLTIAMHLTRNQNFEEAQRWLHFIFDPTDDSAESTPERFWKVKPFQTTDVKRIEEILRNLSTGDDRVLQRDTINSIGKWKDNPFRPHAIARFRPSAYMFKVIMAYLDNLIEWGDFLFGQDSIETINEATQLYVLAANILGPRPQAVPKKGSIRPQTYHNLKADLKEFGSVMRELEVEIPFDLLPHPVDGGESSAMVGLKSIGRSLYFCVPRNSKLIKYWDTVSDRLYKIHNSLNLQGIFRQLPLFQPPIDPALLARAAASGLDIASAVNGLNQPLSLVRYRALNQKAIQIAQNVQSLGRELLSNIEKEDNEALAVLRAKQEKSLLQAAESVKYAQWQAAIKNREGLEQTLLSASIRYVHYERLLGVDESDIEIPELEDISKESLNKLEFEHDEPEIAERKIEVDINRSLGTFALGKKVNTYEAMQLVLANAAALSKLGANITSAIGGAVSMIPNVSVNVQPMGAGVTTSFGGSNLGSGMSSTAAVFSGIAELLNHGAQMSSIIGGYQRREQEWSLQSNIARKEINSIHKQIVAAQINEYVSEKEWKNHQQQIQNAEDIEHFLEGEKIEQHKKTSTKGFYAYLKRESRALYNQYFNLAFEVAKKAERALQQELGKPNLSFLKYDYMGGREKLYAGEKLILDLQRMETAYDDLNIRELELTKHISLRQLDPLSLIQLKKTGACTVSLPEELFDLGGCEGHYFRRIRNVSISIPCIAGPYANVNCTLTLTKSSIRKNDSLANGVYKREGDDAERFSDNFSSLESIVTSSAQTDGGIFDVNAAEERKLPFEYAGAISEWNLELADPENGFPQFDYDTISDLIFHMQYTARISGGAFKNAALTHLKDEFENAGRHISLTMKNDFPTEWYKFSSAEIDDNNKVGLKIDLKKEHYPYWSSAKLNGIKSIHVFAISDALQELEIFDENNQSFALVKNDEMGSNVLSANWSTFDLPNDIGEFELFFEENDFDDLIFIVNYGVR